MKDNLLAFNKNIEAMKEKYGAVFVSFQLPHLKNKFLQPSDNVFADMFAGFSSKG